MKKTHFILLAITAIILTSCCPHEWYDDDNDRTIEGRGEIKTETIPLSDFKGIDLRFVADVNIATGRAYYIDFTAHENILDHMTARVVDSILILEFDRNLRVSNNEDIRVDISMPVVNNIYLKGVGDINIHGPEQNQMSIVVDGVGNINAYDLQVNRANVKLNGCGDVKVNATKMLDIIINGVGNVYYKGNPDVSKRINGIGEIRNN